MLARRCLEAGIHNIFCDQVELEEKSERVRFIDFTIDPDKEILLA